MAKSLKEWVATDVKEVKGRSLDWLASQYFFRDPNRPLYSDSDFFFSPADGIILYQNRVQPDEKIIDIKGKNYTLRDALRDDTFDQECLVIGIFMTFYDVHINRIPYPGNLSYQELDPISTHNFPMLDVEKELVEEIKLDFSGAEYLHNNQRMKNRIFASDLQLTYYLLQIADYDVNVITPFNLDQNSPVSQNERFSMIRYGSQVDLIVPISQYFEWETIQDPGVHVEAGIDPLIKINPLYDYEDDEFYSENEDSTNGEAANGQPFGEDEINNGFIS